jgi:MFS family permease
MTNAPFRIIVWPFAFSQTISWATLFYIFPSMFSIWEQDFGWSKAQISGALTCALLLSAIFAPVAGRIIDRGFFVTIHVGGTIIGVLLLLALSRVEVLWQFYLVWALLGVIMAGVLYEPCFAILTRTFDKRARAAITRVTLVAGLAGTLSFPSSHYLVEAYGWRTTTVIFAVVLAIFAIPLAWGASYIAQKYSRQINTETNDNPRVILNIVKTFPFWMLVISYIAFSLDHGMILSHLLPLLDERGVAPATAIIAASFIGPMQVVGRLVMMGLEKHVSTVAVAATALSALSIAALAIYWANIWFGLIIVFVVLQGAGNGVSSIVRPLLNAELLGRKNFGLISGVMALPFIGGFAAGPFISALLWEIGGYDTVLLFAVVISMIGVGTLLLAARSASHQS